MIDINQLKQTIAELEDGGTTLINCSKLADLYVVLDHVENTPKNKNLPPISGGSSEFMTVINGKNSDEVWAIIDELMSAIKLTMPRAYAEVIHKISSI